MQGLFVNALRFQLQLDGCKHEVIHGRCYVGNLGKTKKIKAAKDEWTEEKCKNIEKGMISGNSKEAYNTLYALTKTQQPKSAVNEDGSGKHPDGKHSCSKPVDCVLQWPIHL